jgi:hypothetical protein
MCSSTIWVSARSRSARRASSAGTPSPDRAETTMRECADLGIKHVWMHRGPGGGSVSPAAAAFGREQGIAVIDGGCPCMFGPTADRGHKVMRAFLTLSGNVPRQV